MLTIYIHGCRCGTTATYIRRVELGASKIGEEVQVFNSKYNEDNRMYHRTYLKYGGFDTDKYLPIIVGHNSVKLLKEWQP